MEEKLTTIAIKPSNKNKLNDKKIYPKQSYDKVIEMLLADRLILPTKKEQSQPKPTEKKINNSNFNNLISSSKVTDKIKGIIKETEERSNIINQEELNNINKTSLHETYAKIR